ncbi:MAG: alpha-amylase [Chloroflexi bacterium AL-W]|nr:alpha-amylase [Chloroflexi bacterium AL-N1]NOK67342.1 alpha-amylase [Chloroflexi bacterium AL-N10]NOK75166.1 alpha-amylase [Chloroflexi bacterium AL-N5]NOK81954.1 alpha-amylase [Chloroflexi bacterium AL-W]NOK89799.1 alpha-amylase [Chloroflexi bacterium AL-N15]
MNLGSVVMEIHVSRAARDRYQFDETLFTYNGTVIFANFHAVRIFAEKINQKRDLINFPEQAVFPSQLNAVGLIHEVTHHVFKVYRDQRNPQLMSQMQAALQQRLGPAAVDAALLRFVNDFPPISVYRGQTDARTFLSNTTNGVPNRHLMLEEMIMLWIANSNPAFEPFSELFGDESLRKDTAYYQMMSNVHTFFDSQPGVGVGEPNLIDLLLTPARVAPHSLEAQLDYIRQHWGAIVGAYIYRLLSSLDLIKEEGRMFLQVGAGVGEHAEVPIYEAGAYEESERFSPDRDWMPQLVMLAKNAYVWLDQLSKKYERRIATLDQIPDEELDALQEWGFTGLWLIGLWERSGASQRIKQMCGNPEAVASAYSLYDYQAAQALGGEAGCNNLRERAWQRGIRLASDMVPNHVGVDGRWVMEHPDWFVSLDHSPFPAYSFNGPDLSWDERVGIYIDDHYYSRTDAAVVFKRVDRWTGSEKYIYHGNDGTSMPWNDTAQLNYLNPEVREAVIQTILHVARQFPVIRFDAAMTLAKKHFQRLWFPEPGSGGDIPSRAGYGMTRELFDALMPQEFWREVVDRVAVEAPDTLLLAEAFWLMEGYFVRTLGMHRVYNSAFMHMLRDEDNAKYRQLMKNTLEFDPEILKRYVNFMNNPDERTAVDQFGKDDKYFGACTVLSTLPGLPMFGHGQVEGYSEKYGMEYQRAYWDEWPDDHLIERHQREVFPILHRRYLFAEVRDFLLYDFYATDGHVNEDVFAYSNRYGDERGLVVYHNKFATVSGWIRTSVAFSVKIGNGDARELVQRSLGEGLGLSDDGEVFCIFRDYTAGEEFIRSSKDMVERGLFVHLDAYKCHVFLDFREVRDDETRRYAELNAYLDGRGVPSVDEAIRETFLQPIHRPLRELINAEMFNRLMAARVAVHEDGQSNGAIDKAIIDDVEQKMLTLMREAKTFVDATGDEEVIAKDISSKLQVILSLPVLEQQLPKSKTRHRAAIASLNNEIMDASELWDSVWSWLFIHSLGRLITEEAYEQQSRSLIDEWLLGHVITRALEDKGLDERAVLHALVRVKQLTSQQRWFERHKIAQVYAMLESWLSDTAVRQLLGVNRSQGILWFNKEAFDRLLWWMLFVAVVSVTADSKHNKTETTSIIVACYDTIEKLQKAADSAGYQVEKLLDAVRSQTVEAKPKAKTTKKTTSRKKAQ